MTNYDDDDRTAAEVLQDDVLPYDARRDRSATDTARQAAAELLEARAKPPTAWRKL